MAFVEIHCPHCQHSGYVAAGGLPKVLRCVGCDHAAYFRSGRRTIRACYVEDDVVDDAWARYYGDAPQPTSSATAAAATSSGSAQAAATAPLIQQTGQACAHAASGRGRLRYGRANQCSLSYWFRFRFSRRVGWSPVPRGCVANGYQGTLRLRCHQHLGKKLNDRKQKTY